MREIIFHQIGQCGNQIGLNFWESISSEHSIDPCGHYVGYSDIQLQQIAVYYNETSSQCKYVPRVIITDLEPDIKADIQATPYGGLFSPESFICGNCGAGNNWARGYYTEGAGIMDEVLDKTRREAETCDCLQGFQIVHSTGGGTGSGMGSLLFEMLFDEYSTRIINTCSVLPSPLVSETVVEPYNAIFTIKSLMNSTHEAICVDNETLYRICRKNLGIKLPTFQDLNYIVAYALAGITTCFRFPGQLNTDLKKLYVNMVPFPKLHFFSTVFAPLIPDEVKYFKRLKVPDLVTQLFDSKNLMIECYPEHGKYLGVAAIFRGRMSTKLVEVELAKVAAKQHNNFAAFLPKHFKSAICDIPPRGFNMSATLLMNSTAIHEIFQRLLSNYTLMLRRRAFMHWYTGEGMEEQEFFDAEHFVSKMINEYLEISKEGKSNCDGDGRVNKSK